MTYCPWNPRVGGALEKITRKGTRIPELATAITELYVKLWSTCTKSSRASLALRVFPDLTDEELEKLSLVDAYVNALDDTIDLECIDQTRGPGVRMLYARTILLVNKLLMHDATIRYYLGEIGGNTIFDAEYRAQDMLHHATTPREALRIVEQIYINQANGAWIFFALPAQNRLSPEEADRLVRAGILFRALWLILDHLEDLEEDRSNNTLTGARYIVDILQEPLLLHTLVERIKDKLEEALREKRGNVYMEKLREEYSHLSTSLDAEIQKHTPPRQV